MMTVLAAIWVTCLSCFFRLSALYSSHAIAGAGGLWASKNESAACSVRSIDCFYQNMSATVAASREAFAAGGKYNIDKKAGNVHLFVISHHDGMRASRGQKGEETPKAAGSVSSQHGLRLLSCLLR